MNYFRRHRVGGPLRYRRVGGPLRYHYPKGPLVQGVRYLRDGTTLRHWAPRLPRPYYLVSSGWGWMRYYFPRPPRGRWVSARCMR